MALFDDYDLLFVPQDARTGFGAAKGRTISMSLKLDDGDIFTQDGRPLTNKKWSAWIVESDAYNELASENDAIGFMLHHKAISTLDVADEESVTLSA